MLLLRPLLRRMPALGSAAAPAAARRALSTTPAAPPRVVRFIAAHDSEEYFGVFADPTETSCRVCLRDEDTGKLSITTIEYPVDVILPPVEPPAVWCVGLNYADHAAEVKMAPPEHPILFSKAVSSLIGHKGAIIIPRVASDPPEVDYEAELAVVIGREAKNVSEAEALSHVLGYCIANDVTARRWQGKKGSGQWARAKSFDTFLPLGPYLTPAAAVPDPQALAIRTLVNGDLVQDGNTRNMITPIAKLIAFISQGTTLLPGTVILTGTPAGVGYTRGKYLAPGDTVTITIEGLGMLTNNVVAE
jgi:2-keto-4-pentenoate hydratase/2-oxohepta-3-ene-1,7-dioic acid hydratase in catechol pathway